jgi:glycine cleavage system H protein
LDKPEGVIAREMALYLLEAEDAEVICPVLLNNSPNRYERTLTETSLMVIDGCQTRCASKLANKLGLKVDDKVLVSEQAKTAGIDVGKSLRPGPEIANLVETMVEGLAKQAEAVVSETAVSGFEAPANYLTVNYDKYIFKIPSEGYLFNENDCWVRVIGNIARVGVSDYVQQNMTDITYFEPAKVGAAIVQFDEVGSLESAKSMVDVLSPVSGRIIAVNTDIESNPEFINEDPYYKGWVAEIELSDFDADKELLISPEAYSKIVERKAADSAR